MAEERKRQAEADGKDFTEPVAGTPAGDQQQWPTSLALLSSVNQRAGGGNLPPAQPFPYTYKASGASEIKLIAASILVLRRLKIGAE